VRQHAGETLVDHNIKRSETSPTFKGVVGGDKILNNSSHQQVKWKTTSHSSPT